MRIDILEAPLGANGLVQHASHGYQHAELGAHRVTFVHFGIVHIAMYENTAGNGRLCSPSHSNLPNHRPFFNLSTVGSFYFYPNLNDSYFNIKLPFNPPSPYCNQGMEIKYVRIVKKGLEFTFKFFANCHIDLVQFVGGSGGEVCN